MTSLAVAPARKASALARASQIPLGAGAEDDPVNDDVFVALQQRQHGATTADLDIIAMGPQAEQPIGLMCRGFVRVKLIIAHNAFVVRNKAASPASRADR